MMASPPVPDSLAAAFGRPGVRPATHRQSPSAGHVDNVNANGDAITGKVKVTRYAGGLVSVGGVTVNGPLGLKTTKLPDPGRHTVEFSGKAARLLPLADRWRIESHPFGATDGVPLPWFQPERLSAREWKAVQDHRLFRDPLSKKLAAAVRRAAATMAPFDHLSFRDGEVWAHRADGASTEEDRAPLSSESDDRSERSMASKKERERPKRKKQDKKDKSADVGERKPDGTAVDTSSPHQESHRWRLFASGLAALGSLTAGLLLLRAGWLLFREIDYLDDRMVPALWGIPGRVDGVPGLVNTATTVLLLAATTALLAVLAVFLGSWRIRETPRSRGSVSNR